jgi:hypothetical protein
MTRRMGPAVLVSARSVKTAPILRRGSGGGGQRRPIFTAQGASRSKIEATVSNSMEIPTAEYRTAAVQSFRT